MQKTTVISVVSTKGGTGKTTFCANLAGLLADMGMRVLMVDGDPQGSLSSYFELRTKPAEHGLSHVLYDGGIVTESCICETTIERLHVMQARLMLADGTVPAENWLQTRLDGPFLLRKAVRGHCVQSRFDVVVIDSPGKSGVLTSMAALAGDMVVASFRPDMLTYAAFYSGLMPLLSACQSLREISPDMHVGQVKVLLNDVPRTNNARLIAHEIRQTFRPDTSKARPIETPIAVLDTFIPRMAVFPEATSMRTPVHLYQDRSRRSRDGSGGQILHDVVHELLPHLKGVYAMGYRPTAGRDAA